MPGARAMTQQQFRQEAEPAFSRVFQSRDPFDEPIAPVMPDRAILYYVSYTLKSTELKALSAAARAVGDDALYISVTGRLKDDPRKKPGQWHWLSRLTT